MTDIILTEAQKEEIQKEIKIIKSSETGRLYLDKKFNGADPTDTEMINVNSCGLFALVQRLDKVNDKELKSRIKPLTRNIDNAESALLIEEIAGFKFSYDAEVFQIRGMQSLRKKLDKEHAKKKERKFETYKKLILKTATITDHINIEKALIDAKHKADETPPPPYLSFASEALTRGVIWRDNNIKQSSKGSQFLRRFICIAYRTAKKPKISDNSIFENIAAILNILAVKGDKQFTNKNIQSYVRRNCTE